MKSRERVVPREIEQEDRDKTLIGSRNAPRLPSASLPRRPTANGSFFMPFESPQYTQAPNDLFDLLMRDMSETELKVTLAVIRGTLGYHKKGFKLSLSKITDIT